MSAKQPGSVNVGQHADRDARSAGSAFGTRVMNRRAAVRLLLGGAGLTILAACTPSAPPAASTQAPAQARPTDAPKPAAAATSAPAAAATTAPAPAAAAKPTDAPKPAGVTPSSGGTLRIGQAGDIVNFDPHFYQFASSEAVWLGYDRLIQYDAQFKPHPMLAESWDVSSDAKQITFKLRKGVQFHSGREMTSDDVKWTSEPRHRPEGRGRAVRRAGQVVHHHRDAGQVHHHPEVGRAATPDVRLLRVPQYHGSDGTLEGPDATTKSCGTGPFMIKEWVQGDHSIFEQEQELLAERQAVPRRHRGED